MSIRRVRALTSGATNFYGAAAVASPEPAPKPVVARGDSLTHSAITEPVVSPASPGRLPAVFPRSPTSVDVGALPPGAASDTSVPITIPVGVAFSSPGLLPRREPRLRVELPDLPTRPDKLPVDGPKSPLRRAASARAEADAAAAASSPPPPRESRDARTQRILSSIQSSLATAAAEAILRECSLYDYNHPGVVELDVLSRSLVRLVPGVTPADLQHVMQAVGLSDVTQMKVRQRARPSAALVARGGTGRASSSAGALPGDKTVVDKQEAEMDIQGVHYVRFLRRVMEDALEGGSSGGGGWGASPGGGRRRGSVAGATLDAQIDGLRARLAEQDLFAHELSAEDAHAELARGGNRIAQVAAALKALDGDKDGAVTLREFQEGLVRQRVRLSDEEAGRLVRMIDPSSDDGRVHVSELVGHFADGIAPERKAARPPPPEGARTHDNVRSSLFRPDTLRSLSGLLDGLPELSDALPRGAGPAALRFFSAVDSDHDGFVSRAQLHAHLKEQVLRNRRWAHPNVSDSVGARVDAAVDHVVALCDTNGDGFIDVADVAAVASAARTVPAVPSCMPGGGSATAAALSGADDVRSGGVAGEPLGTPNDAELPPPLDRMRRASGASSSSSGGPQRWPPRPHLRYETIGDIVSFLQPNTALQEGTWRLPPNKPLRRHVVNRVAPWDAAAASRPLSESARAAVDVDADAAEVFDRGGLDSPSAPPALLSQTARDATVAAIHNSSSSRGSNRVRAGGLLAAAASVRAPSQEVLLARSHPVVRDALLRVGTPEGGRRTLGSAPHSSSLRFPATRPHWMTPTDTLGCVSSPPRDGLEALATSTHHLSETKRLKSITASDAVAGLDPESGAALSQKRLLRNQGAAEHHRSTQERYRAALKAEGEVNERLHARTFVRFRLHDDTLPDTAAFYLQGLVPGDDRSGKRVFAPQHTPGYVNHRSGAHIPLKLGY